MKLKSTNARAIPALMVALAATPSVGITVTACLATQELAVSCTSTSVCHRPVTMEGRAWTVSIDSLACVRQVSVIRISWVLHR